jgi:hypothetical protein
MMPSGGTSLYADLPILPSSTASWPSRTSSGAGCFLSISGSSPRGREPEGIEVESYLPEIFYRYGQEESAYAEILALSDPTKKRREYPEVAFAVIGAVATGLMGVKPDARILSVETRSSLTGATAWAELRNLPVFDGVIHVRHDGRRRTSFTVRSGGDIVWKAVFDGAWDELEVDGTAHKALHGVDEAGRLVSWATVRMTAGRTSVAGPKSSSEEALSCPIKLMPGSLE